MEQITCVLVHPDSAEREDVGLTLEAAGMRSVAVCADWPQTLNVVSRVRPTVVFVHALAPGLDAEQASSQLDARRLCRRPALVYLVPSYLPETMTRGMEPRRLTEHSKQTSHENGICCTHFRGPECLRVGGNCAMNCKWEEAAWSRLAAYEDTRLEPEEIDMDHEAAEQLRHLCRNCDIDRLEELAEADKNGRVV